MKHFVPAGAEPPLLAPAVAPSFAEKCPTPIARSQTMSNGDIVGATGTAGGPTGEIRATAPVAQGHSNRMGHEGISPATKAMSVAMPKMNAPPVAPPVADG